MILGRPRAPVFVSSRCVFPRGPPWNAGLTRGQLLGKYGLDAHSLPHFVSEAEAAVFGGEAGHEEEQHQEEETAVLTPSS